LWRVARRNGPEHCVFSRVFSAFLFAFLPFFSIEHFLFLRRADAYLNRIYVRVQQLGGIHHERDGIRHLACHILLAMGCIKPGERDALAAFRCEARLSRPLGLSIV
jgi:hypothetical protein